MQMHQVKDSVGIWFNPKIHGCDSDLGPIEYSNPRPDRGEVGKLMLITKDWVDNENRTPFDPWPAYLDVEDGRKFYTIQYASQLWRWELFDAHWTDVEDSCPCYIGQLVSHLTVTIEESR